MSRSSVNKRNLVELVGRLGCWLSCNTTIPLARGPRVELQAGPAEPQRSQLCRQVAAAFLPQTAFGPAMLNTLCQAENASPVMLSAFKELAGIKVAGQTKAT